MSIFNSVPITRPNRTAFNLSHHLIGTTDFGRLVPTGFFDMVPGDTMRLSMTPLVRFFPMMSPPFGDVNVSCVAFAVPMRLTNAKFGKFITGYYSNPSETGSSQFLQRENMMLVFPPKNSYQQLEYFADYFDSNKLGRVSLLQYLGVNSIHGKAPSNLEIEAARFLSFWYVYFEYFVDQNVGYYPEGVDVTPIELRGEDGTIFQANSIRNWEEFTQIALYRSTNSPAVGGYLTIGDCIANGTSIDLNSLQPNVIHWLFTLPNKCWPKDYFTSALPWAQKGDPVTVPVDISADGVAGRVRVNAIESNNGTTNGFATLGSAGSGLQSIKSMNPSTNTASVTTLEGTLYDAKFQANSVAFSINELRTSYALQSWLEKNARCGSRYVEQILSHFGVRTSDARLQRPEYLGGFKIPVHISSTAQTSEDGTTPQGNLAGQGVAVGSGKPITFFAEEHMLVITFMYVQPKAYYLQGLSRLLTRKHFSDFYFPEFAHLGEQAIKNSEIYYDPDSNTNDDTFGYQSRYSEYKFMNNRVCGDFYHDSLKSWLFGMRKFNSQPGLSPEFLQVSPRSETSLLSPWADTTQDSFDKLLFQIQFDLNMLRPMPKYGVPYL